MDQPENPRENTAPKPEPPPSPSRWAILRQRDFWLGVALFALMNIAFYGLIAVLSKTRLAFYSGFLLPAAALLANLLVPLLLSKSRRLIAHGMLYTLAFLLIAGAVCTPVFVVAWCFSVGGF